LILINADNPDITQVLATILEKKGYSTLSAFGGAEGIRCLETTTPSLILCDILMPEMDGFQVFRRVRADRRWRSIPFAFLTALSDDETRVTSSEMGVEAYITKPFKIPELVAVISGVLRRAQELQTYTEADTASFKSQLLYTFTHELNTPVSVIRMLTEAMRHNYRRLNEQEMGEYLELLGRSTGELSHIVESMLLALQIDSGRAQALFREWAAPQQVGALVKSCIDKLMPLAHERGVGIAAQGLEADLWVLGHEEQMRHIIGRVLDNAIRFSPRGQEVGVVLSQATGQAQLEITDRGPGLSPDEVKAAFDRLRQVNRERQEQQGVGLSLSLVKDLLSLHGGSIQVRSAPGHGSSFIIFLPVLDAPV
jgi:signal transduction histidine kinase